jgi:hypothetical protein
MTVTSQRYPKKIGYLSPHAAVSVSATTRVIQISGGLAARAVGDIDAVNL